MILGQIKTKIMFPIDPSQPASNHSESPMAPPYVNEDPAQELVEMGLRIAENEKKDAVVDAYEEAATTSDEKEESLDDLNYPSGESAENAPEISAIHEEKP